MPSQPDRQTVRPSVRLRFWGVRGSIPCPGPATVRYGGNTSCMALEQAEGDPVIFDAGTGIRELARELRRSGKPVTAHVLLTHIHWDHIHGLPFFFPLYREDTAVTIYGPAHAAGLRGLLERQMTWEMFPIAPSAQVGLRAVIEAGSEPFPVAGWEVRTQRLCHPGPTQAYRLTRARQDFAYVTDNELAGGAHGVGPAWRDDLVHFLTGVHTLVHDATWADDEVEAYPGWGHSCPRQAIMLARDVGCRRLVLFHHNPEHDDGAMDRHLEQARLTAAATAPGLDVVAAREGESLEL